MPGTDIERGRNTEIEQSGQQTHRYGSPIRSGGMSFQTVLPAFNERSRPASRPAHPQSRIAEHLQGRPQGTQGDVETGPQTVHGPCKEGSPPRGENQR